MIPHPSSSTLFPYTTLFRSCERPAIFHYPIVGPLKDWTRVGPNLPTEDHKPHSQHVENWIQPYPPIWRGRGSRDQPTSAEHTSELQSPNHLLCRPPLARDTT